METDALWKRWKANCAFHRSHNAWKTRKGIEFPTVPTATTRYIKIFKNKNGIRFLCERIWAVFSDLVNPIYGYLWRSFGGDYPKRDGVDQIARLINQIETNPFSRRLIVSGWDPRECDNVDLPPCHTIFQFKVEERAGQRLLHCQLYQRSADAFLGVPFNIASYALLTRMVAHVSDLQVGEFIYSLGDYLCFCHIQDGISSN